MIRPMTKRRAPYFLTVMLTALSLLTVLLVLGGAALLIGTRIPTEMLSYYLDHPDDRERGLYLSDARRTLRLRLLPLSSLDAYSWSPDGERIAAITAGDSAHRGRLMIYSAYGEVLQTLPAFTDRPSQPMWSPDETHLAYVRADRGQAPDLYALNLERGTLEQITRTGAEETVPVWAGETLIFGARGGEHYDLFRAELDGSVEPLTADSAFESDMALSPDGTQLAFISADAIAGSALVLMDLTSDPPAARTLNVGPAVKDHVTWVSAERLVYATMRPADWQIHAVDIRTAQVEVLFTSRDPVGALLRSTEGRLAVSLKIEARPFDLDSGRRLSPPDYSAYHPAWRP
jgi:Tol biopolymer transport system component